MGNIATVLEQLNDLSETQILLIEQINEFRRGMVDLRKRVAALEARDAPIALSVISDKAK
jgi:hypothetical protein